MYYCPDEDTIIFYVNGGNIIAETKVSEFLGLDVGGGNSLELSIQNGFMSSVSECCEDPNIAAVLTTDGGGDPALNVTGDFSVTPSGLRIRMKITNLTVTDVASIVPLTGLSGRNSIIIENRSLTNSVFMGEANVTASGINEGWEISPTSIFSTDVTDAILIYVIAPTGQTANLKVMELA